MDKWKPFKNVTLDLTWKDNNVTLFSFELGGEAKAKAGDDVSAKLLLTVKKAIPTKSLELYFVGEEATQVDYMQKHKSKGSISHDFEPTK
ncbi:expressed unknown protein [Seminavis robusta]|uniref:Uncharacterized protein n=1 Tax=Seminavis robusta TaxID=568900 RepID=A0A9N8HZD6_9STRA|nr:expressed unknown protein [Seminavis robusta]|eukprot:Sro3517_g348810.1 n/a (90) ;mRNA; f:5925-6194